MAEEEEKDIDAEGAEEDSESEEGGKKKLSGKKLVLFVGAPVLVIALGLGAAFFFGLFGGGDGEELSEGEQAEAAFDPQAIVFYNLPDMIVNLNTGGKGTKFLKLKVVIELEDKAAIAVVDPLIPRVVDRFQVYLRQLRVADLSGSAGMYHLKNELLRRLNAAVPVKVKDVLFKEIIIQ